MLIHIFAKMEVFGREGCGFMAGISGSRPFCGNHYAEGECFPGFRTGTEQLDDLCGVILHDNTAMTFAMDAAKPLSRRVALSSRGGNIMGRSIADVFVGGVIYTLSAWAIWIRLRCGPG